MALTCEERERLRREIDAAVRQRWDAHARSEALDPDRLLDALGDGWASASEVAERLGLRRARSRVGRLLAEMPEHVEIRQGVGARRHYRRKMYEAREAGPLSE